MTLSAVDTPFALIGADNNIDGDDKKKGDTNGQIGLFAQLLQGTSVQQLTKIELRRDFDAALQLHDGTLARPEDTRADHRSYDGIGLDTSRYGDAGSSRSDKRLEDVRDDGAAAAPVTAHREPLDPETSVALGFEHPVCGTQVPAAWHWSRASQTTAVAPVHMPA